METEKRVELPPPRDRPPIRHAAATVRPLGDGSRIGNVRRGGHFIARRDRLLQAATNFGLIQKSLAARVFQKPYCCAASLGTTTASPRHAITSHGAMADGSRARWIGTYSAPSSISEKRASDQQVAASSGASRGYRRHSRHRASGGGLREPTHESNRGCSGADRAKRGRPAA